MVNVSEKDSEKHHEIFGDKKKYAKCKEIKVLNRAAPTNAPNVKPKRKQTVNEIE